MAANLKPLFQFCVSWTVQFDICGVHPIDLNAGKQALHVTKPVRARVTRASLSVWRRTPSETVLGSCGTYVGATSCKVV